MCHTATLQTDKPYDAIIGYFRNEWGGVGNSVGENSKNNGSMNYLVGRQANQFGSVLTDGIRESSRNDKFNYTHTCIVDYLMSH